MNKDELEVEVIDRRLQVDLDQQLGIKSNASNQFMPEQGFQSKLAEQQEDEQEEPHFKLQKLLPKQNQKQRLIEQNIKLKTQIYQLAKQLDQILQKDKSKKKTYGIGLNRIEEEDELVRQKKLEVQKQQIELADYKHKIFITKRQLESVYNNGNIMLKEDQIKNLKMELKLLEDEREGHFNIQKCQNKALKVVKNEQQYGDKIKSVTNECARLKKESKVLLDKINQSEKVLLKLHDNHVGKRQNLRQIQHKLTLNKEKVKNKKPNESLITEQMIDNMENEIKKLEMDRKEGEKDWQEKIKAVDVKLILKRNEQEKKLLILRQKERQLKINELKIKELRKMVRQKDEGESRRLSQDMDMSQFRHKRNIIRYQK